MKQDIYRTVERRLAKYHISKVKYTTCIRITNSQYIYHMDVMVAVIHIKKFNNLKVKRLELRNGFNLKNLHYYLHN